MNRPYVRPMAGWWKRDPFFMRYMARELTAFAVGAYAVILCGAWGGIACGIFGLQSLGGLGGVSLLAQLLGTLAGVAWALAGGFVVYGAIKALTSLRLTPEEEYEGADLSIHKIGATPEREASW